MPLASNASDGQSVSLVSPFRALRFASRLRQNLDLLVAPPYDVIAPRERERLASRHPNNVVHLDLPRADPGDDPYRTAERLLQKWIQEGILVRDDRPAFYACEQRYGSPGVGPCVRRGLFARLRLEPYEAGVVIPHERTFEKPRADRQRLLAATRTHLSAVFLLHPDPGGEVARMLAEASAPGPAEEARDDEGTVSRLVRIEADEKVAFVRERLRECWALIADGHHRYESALAYREECRATGRDDSGHLLAFLCSLEDPGLKIVPIHRLLHSLPAFDAERFRERLAPTFRLTRVEGEEALRSQVRERSGRPGIFGLIVPKESAFWLAEWREGAGLDGPALAAVPEPLRVLDVILLHALVLQEVLGITPEAQSRQTNLDYVKEERELFERVRRGGVDVGVLMNATRIQQVVEVTRRGLRLPPKSTYFFPKVLSGLVLDPLDD